MEPISLVTGFLIGAILFTVIWILLLLWAVCRSYEFGWADAKKDRFIGDRSRNYDVRPYGR